MAGNKNNLISLIKDNFTCKICFEVLDDPVQCQNNEHYYCRKCITEHLGNSQTCPFCKEQLTLETVRPAPRIVANVVSQLKKARCSYVSRGCEENVQVEELLLHERTCGYAPVVCSNGDCKEKVNRRDKESHETKECKFRKITCGSCDEELVYVDYKKHRCTLRREINEVKSRLDEVTDTVKGLSLKAEGLEKRVDQYQSTGVVSELIFIIGGHGMFYDLPSSKSLEIFSWRTGKWILVKNKVCERISSFSFLYEKKIVICGGDRTDGIEYLNIPTESGCTSTAASVSLPDNARYNGLLHKDRILTFYKDVVETSLKPPGESRTLLIEEESRCVPAGVHCFDNNVYIVGGKESSMEKYDMAKNEMETLPSLLPKVSNMATVAYKDYIIILGGQDSKSTPLNDVWMYNIHSQKCTRLPSMLEKRTNCSAVIMGNVIVIMGGESKNDHGRFFLNTVEYYVMGASAWQELPPMNLPRHCATACVYV